MGTACKQQAIDIESQFVTEIVVDIIASAVLHIEILISFGHWIVLRNMGYYVDVFCYCAGLVYQDKSAIVNLWPLRSNSMEIPSLGKEFTAQSIWRNNYHSMFVDVQEVLQPSSMVTMSVRDKHIVHYTEVDV